MRCRIECHAPPKAPIGVALQKTFVEASDKTKKRIIKPLLKSTPEELLFASKLRLHSVGKKSAAEIVTKIYDDPEKASEIKTSLDTPQQSKPIKMSPKEALAFFVDAKLTRHKYILIRNEAKRRNADIYPCYDKIRSKEEMLSRQYTIFKHRSNGRSTISFRSYSYSSFKQ